MEKLVRGVYIAGAVVVVSLAVIVAVTVDIPSLGIVLQPQPKYISAGFIYFAFALAMLLIFRLRKVAKQKKGDNLVAQALTGIFVYSGITALVQGLAVMVDLTPSIVNSLFSQSVYFYVAGDGVFLAYFHAEVFRGGIKEGTNLIRFWATVASMLSLVVSTYINILFVLEIWVEALLMIPAFVALLGIILDMSRAAFTTSQKVSDPPIKKGFNLIGWAGVTILVGGAMLLAYNLQSETTSISLPLLVWNAFTYLAISMSMVLLYFGFTFPIRHRPAGQ